MEKIVVCRACGHRNDPQDKQCRACGKRLFTFDPTLESGVEVATTTPSGKTAGATLPSGSERTEQGRMAVDSTDVPIEAVGVRRRDTPAHKLSGTLVGECRVTRLMGEGVVLAAAAGVLLWLGFRHRRRALLAPLLVLLLAPAGCPPRPGTSTGLIKNPGKPKEMVLEGVGGGRVRLSQFRGQPLVVFFFATWCVPCQIQVARLQPVRAALGNDKVAVLGVALDLQKRLVPPFVRAAGFNFPVAYGHPSMVRASPLGPVRGVPRIVILDRKGRAVADFITPVDGKVLLRALKPLVK